MNGDLSVSLCTLGRVQCVSALKISDRGGDSQLSPGSLTSLSNPLLPLHLHPSTSSFFLDSTDHTGMNWTGLGIMVTCTGQGRPAVGHLDCQHPRGHSPPHADIHPAYNRCRVVQWARGRPSHFTQCYHTALRLEARRGGGGGGQKQLRKTHTHKCTHPQKNTVYTFLLETSPPSNFPFIL